jgi:hypothetical protein
VVPSSSGGESESTGVAVFQGFEATSVLFNTPQANYSKLKIIEKEEEEVVNGVASGSVRKAPAMPSRLFKNWMNDLSDDAVNAARYSKLMLSTSATGIKTYSSYSPIYEIKNNSEWDNDSTAFRNYTHSFKTINWEQSDEETLIVEPRTAILKESVGFPNDSYPQWKLNLWVDQRNLPKSDSSTTVTTDSTSVITPPVPPQEGEQTESQDVSLQTTDFLNTATSYKQISISGRKAKDITVKNYLDTSIQVRFYLPGGGMPSELFDLVVSPSASRMKITSSSFAILRGISFATSTFEQELVIAPQESRVFRVATKGSNDAVIAMQLNKVSGSVNPGTSTPEVSFSGGGGGGGCFIATASYGSLNHPMVKLLCEFRDEILLKTSYGQSFVKLYYRYSPPAAEWISAHMLLRILGMILLLPLCLFAWLLLNPLMALSMGIIFTVLRFRPVKR